jgi:hypothetical protein
MQGTTLSRAAYSEASAQVGSTSFLVPLTWVAPVQGCPFPF